MNSHMNTNDADMPSEFTANLNAFRQIEFFSGMPIEVIKLFAYLCKRQTYKTGDLIFQQGDDDGCSYYILSGNTKLVFKNEEKEHFIREYGAEHFLSIMSLMSPMLKQFSLVAQEDTVCLVMTRESFSKVVDQFPDIPLRMTQAIGNRVLVSEKKAIAEFEAKEKANLKNLLGISLL